MSRLNISPVAQYGDDYAALLSRIAMRNNRTQGVALASAARTTSTVSSTIDTSGFNLLVAQLVVTAASGTGGLNLRAYHRLLDDSADVLVFSGLLSANITTTINALQICGAVPLKLTSAQVGYCEVPLSRYMRLGVSHNDASSYTYSLQYELFNI